MLLSVCATAVPGRAAATEARRTSLARSFLHVDDADLFLYPGMIGEWNRYVFVDAYTSNSDADGGIFLGGDVVFGAVFNHEPIWNDVAAMETLYGVPAGLLAPHHVVDLGLAFPSGDSSFGLLFGWGTNVQDSAVEDPADEGSMISSGVQTNVFDLSAGWGMHGEDGTRVDVAGGLTLNLVKLAEDGSTTFEKTPVPGFHLAGRFFSPMTESMDIGIEALLTRRDYGIDVLPGGEATYGRLLGRVSVGPRIRPTERVTIGFFGRLQVESLAGDTNDDPGPTLFSLGLPGAGASVEYQADDHITIRAGGDYQHAYEVRSQDTEDLDADTSVTATTNAAIWGFGVGYGRDGYKLDLAMTGVYDLGAGLLGAPQVTIAGGYLFQ